MFIGLPMSGSEATNWISKPGGKWKPFNSSCGVRGSVERTNSANGSAALRVLAQQSSSENSKRLHGLNRLNELNELDGFRLGRETLRKSGGLLAMLTHWKAELQPEARNKVLFINCGARVTQRMARSNFPGSHGLIAVPARPQ